MAAPLAPHLLTKVEFRAINTLGHAFVGENDPLPSNPNLSDWTWPTYYRISYNAIFGGFGHGLAKPLIIDERLYDPRSQRVIYQGERHLYSPAIVFRPAGTYISVRFSPKNAGDNPDISLEDLDIDKDFGDGS